MTGFPSPSHDPHGPRTAPLHPLLALAESHHQQATNGLISGQFNAMRELRDPKRMLVVYRKQYGGGIVGDELFVAEPTYIQGPHGATLRPGETIVLDFDGNPSVARVEAMLYRALLQQDRDGQALVARHLAHHPSLPG